MKRQLNPVIASLVSLLVASLLAGCGAAVPEPGGETPASANPSPAVEQSATPLAYHGAEVFAVELDRPIEASDADGVVKSWTEAYAVRLELALPRLHGPAVDLWIGERRIAEYGGWEQGIWFWIYDRRALEQLEGQAIHFGLDGQRGREFGRVELGDLDQLPRVGQTDFLANPGQPGGKPGSRP